MNEVGLDGEVVRLKDIDGPRGNHQRKQEAQAPADTPAVAEQDAKTGADMKVPTSEAGSAPSAGEAAAPAAEPDAAKAAEPAAAEEVRPSFNWIPVYTCADIASLAPIALDSRGRGAGHPLVRERR